MPWNHRDAPWQHSGRGSGLPAAEDEGSCKYRPVGAVTSKPNTESSSRGLYVSGERQHEVLEDE